MDIRLDPLTVIDEGNIGEYILINYPSVSSAPTGKN